MPYQIGTWVGAGRWPKCEQHPQFWEKPLAGQVIDVADPRAWANTPDFPMDNPHVGEVMSAAIRAHKTGRLVGIIPVFWDFHTHREVRWEREECLRPYKDDVICWDAAKKQRIDALAHPQRRKQRHFSDFLPEPLRSLYAPSGVPT